MVKLNFIGGFGHSIFASLINAVAVSLILMGAIVGVALIVIIVRYLLITTRAAQVYIELNAPAKPAATIASAPAAATPAATRPATKDPATKIPAAKTTTTTTTTASAATKPSVTTKPATPKSSTPKSTPPKA